MRNLLIAICIIIVAQIVTFLQLQMQFLSTWAKTHPLTMSLLGIPVAYLFIQSTKYCAAAFDGQIWPGRLIGFAIGAIVFTFMSIFLMKEPMTVKTFVCLILSAGILGIQILWK
jgi:hypothetical protein